LSVTCNRNIRPCGYQTFKSEISYSIKTVFWLDDFEVRVRSSYWNVLWSWDQIDYDYIKQLKSVLKFYQLSIDWLIDWCLTPTLAVFQLYRGVENFIYNKLIAKNTSLKINIFEIELLYRISKIYSDLSIRGITRYFTHLKWSLEPPEFIVCCTKYSWKCFQFYIVQTWCV
jgi:hypothetical protein